MGDNTKYVARVPIVPDNFDNKDEHKNHELVMDFNEVDLYVKDGDGYINITGQIRESIKEIQDGSSVIHIVTEDTLPSIEDRLANHWYYVITKAEESGSGDIIATANYIYYGTVQSYYNDKNYLLISQNTTIGSSRIKFEIEEGYSPCLYIPANMSATFTKVKDKYVINQSSRIITSITFEGNRAKFTTAFKRYYDRFGTSDKFEITFYDEEHNQISQHSVPIGRLSTIPDSVSYQLPTETKTITARLLSEYGSLSGSADITSGETIDFTKEDRVYAINTLTGTYIAYDVYILELYEPGTYYVNMNIEGSNYFIISFDTNESGVPGLELPDEMKVRDGEVIGTIEDPTWTDPRFVFQGWSLNKMAFTEVHPDSYRPDHNITLYAWFEYNNDSSLSGYSVDEISG